MTINGRGVVLEKKCIKVTFMDDKWGVDFNGKNGNRFIRMQSKEDAVRYARTCEQRTGCNVSISENLAAEFQLQQKPS